MRKFLLKNAEERQKTITLSLDERFFLINVIGGLPSNRQTLTAYIKLLDELSLTREESLTPDLNLHYDSSSGTFKWNSEISLNKSIIISQMIFDDLKSILSYNSSSKGHDLYVKFN